jgi:hypothetical protein
VVGLGADLSTTLRSQQVARGQCHPITIRGQPCGIRSEVRLAIDLSARGRQKGIAERTSARLGNFREPARLSPSSSGKVPNSS